METQAQLNARLDELVLRKRALEQPASVLGDQGTSLAELMQINAEINRIYRQLAKLQRHRRATA